MAVKHGLLLLDIMLHALMAKFQLALFIFITYFSTVVPLTGFCFFPAGLSSLTPHFKQVLLGVEACSVSWLGQLTVGVQITNVERPSQKTEETSTPYKTC